MTHPAKLIGSWVENTVVAILLALSGWLQRRSSSRWEKVVEARDHGGGPRSSRKLPEPYRPVYRKTPEILTGKGASVDTARLMEAAVAAGPMPRVIPDWAREIQPFLANQLSRHTRRAYETDLKQFFLFLEGRIPVESIDQVRPEHIILYRKYLEEGRDGRRPREKTTINRKLAVVKSFLNWLRANHVIKENPAALVKGFPQNQESSLKGLSDEEAKRILMLPRLSSRAGALHSAILHVLMYLGLRKGELIDLKIGDLDEERGTPVLKVRGKGHRVRILPMTPIVRLAIDNYFAACQRDRTDKEAPLFTPTKNPRTRTMKKAMNPNAITYIVVKYAKKAGILKKISPHSCRATCISNALDKKATQRSVQHLAGWSTPLMIQRYDKRREDLKNSAAFLVDYGEGEETDVVVGNA